MPLRIAGQQAPKPTEPDLTLSFRASSYPGRVMLEATDQNGNVTKIARFAIKNGRLVFHRRTANPTLVAVDGSGKIAEDGTV